MSFYRRTTPNKNVIPGVEKFAGETIEQKCRRIVEEDEPIKDGAPEIFTDRKDGVIAAYNIRTDRFEIAAEAMDAVNRSQIARSENNPGKVVEMKPDKTEGNQAKDVGEA